jgi:hypothetical protein
MPFYADTAAHAVAPEEGSGKDCSLLSFNVSTALQIT